MGWHTQRYDQHDSVPIYRRIEADLRHRIAQGTWPVGAMLPSRKTLAAEYNVDLRTLQHAISSLLDDGTLETIDRRGTFVAHIGDPPEPPIPAFQPQLATVSENGHLPLTDPSGRPLTISIVAPCGYGELVQNEPRSPWVEAIVRFLEYECSTRGGLTHFVDLLMPDSSDLRWPSQILPPLMEEGIDGLILVDIHQLTGLLDDLFQTSGLDTLPMAIISYREVIRPIPHVFYDNRYAGYQAAEHLIQAGYQQIVYFAPYLAQWMEERLSGIQAAIQHAGLPETALTIFPQGERPLHHHETQLRRPDFRSDRDVQLVHALVEELPTGSSPYGVIAVTDNTAWHILDVAQAQGLIAGEDFGLIGFDDRSRSRQYGLSSLRPPLEGLASTAVQQLANLVHHTPVPMQVRLTSQLVTRSSTRHI